jgi:hypothetical protein
MLSRETLEDAPYKTVYRVTWRGEKIPSYYTADELTLLCEWGKRDFKVETLSYKVYLDLLF